MVTGDGAYIKKINRGVILENIIAHGMISRADLSKITGLNKATISVQVNHLLDNELVHETQQEHNTVGRRPIMLSVNREAGYVLGIDLDYRLIQYTVSDLQGYPVCHDTVDPGTADFHAIAKLLSKHIKAYQQKFAKSHYGLLSAVIGIHGTVNNDEMIYFVPAYQWHNKDLKSLLCKELDLAIRIENNANLSALAERVYNYHESDNLLALLLSSGIGAGMMLGGELHKGYHGFAGEMGHMIISPDGKQCTCGNKGCWELYSAEPSFFKQLAAKLGKQQITWQELSDLITAKDPAAGEQMEQFITYLAIGLNNIINVYNPERIVLNSAVLNMYPHAVDRIESQLVSSVSQYREITLSKLGVQSCVMGACALAIQQFLDVPKLLLHGTEEHLAAGHDTLLA